MKLKDLKQWINALSDKELESELKFNSDDFSISGSLEVPEKAIENYYHLGEDYPGPLFTKEELLSDGYDEGEINGFTIVISEGSYFFDLEVIQKPELKSTPGR